MVKNHKVNWQKVKDIINASEIIVAHNSKFDRSFIEKYISTKSIWACSQNDVNGQKDFFKNNLELLCI